MVLGNATQKIQTIVELAEDLYEKVTELREQILELRETLEQTNNRVSNIETELTEQRAILQAIADEHDINSDDILAELDDPDGENQDASDTAESPAATDSEADSSES